MGLAEIRAYGESRAEFWKNPPRGQCSVEGCPEADAILYVPFGAGADEGICAGHYREQVKRDRPYPCDNEGDGREHGVAFRDPLHRRDEYYCKSCHEEMGYLPGERAMVTKVAARVGVTHSMGRKAVCMLKGQGDCGGEVKQRGKVGEVCNRHWNPKKYDANKGA